jgi:hypothetical protein
MTAAKPSDIEIPSTESMIRFIHYSSELSRKFSNDVVVPEDIRLCDTPQ